MDDAQQGTKALSASDFPSAIRHFTRALTVNPHATDYYIKRSTAYSRLKPADGGPNAQAALSDAEMAVALGVQRARRELILAGQMRRAIVLYQLERFGDADFLFKIIRAKTGPVEEPNSAKNVASAMGGQGGENNKAKNQELQIWEMKVKSRLDKLESGDERAKVTVTEVPDIKVPNPEDLKKIYQQQLQELGETGSLETKLNTPAASAPKPTQDAPVASKDSQAPTSSQPPAEPVAPVVYQPSTPTNVRHEWYQSHDTVVVTLYAKGVPKDKAEVEIQDQSVCQSIYMLSQVKLTISQLAISFPLPTGADFFFNLDPLYAPIDTNTSRASVMSTKIEVLLRKKEPGIKWKALESVAGAAPTPQATTVQSQSSTTAAKAPAYPTSARGGAKDWDKLAQTLTKKKKKTDDKAEGDAADEDEGAESDTEYGGDPVYSFFKKLYANADPDTRRAMVKSYYESEGTALSTNWSDVGKKKVEPHPPSSD